MKPQCLPRLVATALMGCVAVALLGCERSGTATHYESNLLVDGPVPATVRLNGIEIAVEPPVRFYHKAVTVRTVGADEIDHSQTQEINGHPFGVEDGEFLIGDSRFGPVHSGDKVRVTEAGVFVGDERRGDTPK